MAVCILSLALFGIVGNSFITSPLDTVIKINGQKITQVDFDHVYNQVSRAAKNSDPNQRQQSTSQALNEIIRQEVFNQEAKKFGITVSDQQLQMQLASYQAFQKEGKFDLPTYGRMVVQVMGMSPRDFEKSQRKDIAGRAVNQLVANSVHISEDEFQSELAHRLASEKDAAKRKELLANPEQVRNEMRDKELNLVFNDWLTQLNSALKVNIVSESFRQRMGAPATAQ